jgi:hypothetical protein
VVAEKVDQARFSGFSIVGDAEMPLSAGIVLTDSGVEIDDVEVSGAEVGVVIRGGGKPALRGSLIRECTVGVLATGPVEPWISHNAIARNRKSGLVASDGAHPALTGNVFERNRVELPTSMDMKPVREHNFFVGVPASGGRGGAAGTPSGNHVGPAGTPGNHVGPAGTPPGSQAGPAATPPGNHVGPAATPPAGGKKQ